MLFRSNWAGRNIYLHLEGAKSGVYVYLNGKEVGYNEDTKDPAGVPGGVL